MCAVAAPKPKEPNQKDPHYDSEAGKHTTDSESGKRINKRGLTNSITLAHVRTKDKKITKPNIEVPSQGSKSVSI